MIESEKMARKVAKKTPVTSRYLLSRSVWVRNSSESERMARATSGKKDDRMISDKSVVPRATRIAAW